MPAATKTQSTLASPITQTNLKNQINTAMTAAGFSSPYDQYTGGYYNNEQYLVYQIVLDSNATAGTVYLRIKISAELSVSQALYPNWNATNHNSQASGAETTSVTFATNTDIGFLGLATSEYRFVLLTQTSNYCPLGYVRPTLKPSWWNENSFPFCFIPYVKDFSQFYGIYNSPYGTSSYAYDSSLNVSRMSSANPLTNKRDIIAGVILYGGSSGAAARTSDDFVMVAASGLTRFDTIQVNPGAEEYILLNPSAGGLAIRTI